MQFHLTETRPIAYSNAEEFENIPVVADIVSHSIQSILFMADLNTGIYD